MENQWTYEKHKIENWKLSIYVKKIKQRKDWTSKKLIKNATWAGIQLWKREELYKTYKIDWQKEIIECLNNWNGEDSFRDKLTNQLNLKYKEKEDIINEIEFSTNKKIITPLIKNTNIKIWIDLDDTLMDLMGQRVPLLNKKYKKNISLNDIKLWDFLHLYDITLNDFKNSLFEFWLYADCNPSPTAIQWLKEYNKKYPCYIITSRFSSPEYNTEEFTKNWLNKHGYTFTDFIISNDKGTDCKNLWITHFIDDWLHNHINVINKNPKIQSYLIDKPWNGEHQIIAEGKKHENINHIIWKLKRVKSIHLISI